MDEIKNIAIKAVKAAGEIIKNNTGQIREISFKQKNDYLTNIDIEAENTIKEIIGSVFPEHSFFSEESELSTKTAEFTWFVDPLSSTINYIHGFPHFATAVALRERKNTLFACVLDPMYDELFYAEKGKGAFLNEQKIQVSSVDALANAMVFLGLYMKGERKIDENIPYLKNMLNNISDYRRIGSTALQFCYVACGRADAYTHNNSDIFAIPAGKLILEEAGGRLTDFGGNEWDLESKNIVATNNLLHEEIITILN
jgi:myo-inositol-1(or 4)-monophosphatase